MTITEDHPRRDLDTTAYALAVACDALEHTGARATAHPRTEGGWNIQVTGPDGTSALEGFHIAPMDSGDFPGNTVGHRLIERGWTVRSCAHFAPDRSAAGWKQDPDDPRTWTAPVQRDLA